MGFTPSAGKELQSEYFVARQHAVEAILAVQRLHDQISPHLLISEIRTIAADDLWMSPCYHQASVTIHFTWKQDWPAVSRLLPVIEKELGPFQPRPHWGKLFTVQSEQLHWSYVKLPEFVRLAKKYDPQGKFQNEFLRTTCFSGLVTWPGFGASGYECRVNEEGARKAQSALCFRQSNPLLSTT